MPPPWVAHSLLGWVLDTHRLPSQSRLPRVPLKHSKGIRDRQGKAAGCRLQRQGPALGTGSPPRTRPLWHRVPLVLGGLGAGAHLPSVQPPHGGLASPGTHREDTMAPTVRALYPEGAMGRGPACPMVAWTPGSGAGWHHGLEGYAPALGGQPVLGHRGVQGGLAHLSPPARPWHHWAPTKRPVSPPVGTCTHLPHHHAALQRVLTSLPGGPVSPLSP